MHHFFVTPGQVKGDRIYIEGRDVNHIRNVLRMKPGEKIQVSDGNNRKYLCSIEAITAERVCASIGEELRADNELPSRLYLFQGLPKGDKMDLIIQKAVELGVYEIIPVCTKRVVVKLDEKKKQKRGERWAHIAQSAAKQAGRNVIPNVTEPMSFPEAVRYAGALDVILMPYELAGNMRETRNVLAQIRPGQSVGILIGPEGGFEKEEVEYAAACGAKILSLGKRILRTETAGLAALAILMCHLESD